MTNLPRPQNRVSAYAPHRAYVNPARGAATLMQTLIGYVLIEAMYSLVRSVFDTGLASLGKGIASWYGDRSTPGALILDLAAFAILALLVGGVLRHRHDRSWVTVVAPDAAPALDRHATVRGDGMHRAAAMFLRSLVLGCLFYLGVEILAPFWTVQPEFTMRPIAIWLAWLPLALVALFIQTGAEEFLYRGYLQQQIAARWDHPLVWMVLPNIAFASVHWFNGVTIADSLSYVIWAFFFGLAASDLVARTGNLGAAIGFHMANNIYAFCIVAERGAVDSGLALFLIAPDLGRAEPADADLNAGLNTVRDILDAVLTPGLGVELVIIAVAWLVVRVAIRR